MGTALLYSRSASVQTVYSAQVAELPLLGRVDASHAGDIHSLIRRRDLQRVDWASGSCFPKAQGLVRTGAAQHLPIGIIAKRENGPDMAG